jgi:hypothetical protein
MKMAEISIRRSSFKKRICAVLRVTLSMMALSIQIA